VSLLSSSGRVVDVLVDLVAVLLIFGVTSLLHPKEELSRGGLEFQEVNPARGALLDALENGVFWEDDEVRFCLACGSIFPNKVHESVRSLDELDESLSLVWNDSLGGFCVIHFSRLKLDERFGSSTCVASNGSWHCEQIRCHFLFGFCSFLSL
jgi:hypothetical protein